MDRSVASLSSWESWGLFTTGMIDGSGLREVWASYKHVPSTRVIHEPVMTDSDE